MSKTTCKFYINERGIGFVLAGKIVFDDKKLKLFAVKGHENVIKSVSRTAVYVGDEDLTPDKDPEKWLHALPAKYSGIGIRAWLVPKSGKSTKESTMPFKQQDGERIQRPRTENYPVDKNAHAVTTGKKNSPRGFASNKRERI
jgi:hypothetical protein